VPQVVPHLVLCMLPLLAISAITSADAFTRSPKIGFSSNLVLYPASTTSSPSKSSTHRTKPSRLETTKMSEESHASATTIKRGVVNTALGSIFYLICDGRTITDGDDGSSLPLLCFHMSPRSSDEYLEVLPLLAENDGRNNGRVVIALDAPGYGASENPTRSCTIDDVSDAFLEVANELLGPDAPFAVAGSLMGNFHCVSLASRYPDRIRGGIITNPWYSLAAAASAETKKAAAQDSSPGNSAIEDSYVLREDGSHLIELHDKRKWWLDPELNLRVVHSEMGYLINRRVRYAKGISIESADGYDFEAAVRSLRRTSFLCIKGQACAELFDKFGLDGTQRFEKACQLFRKNDEGKGVDGAASFREDTLTGEKSTLNLVNQMPDEFAALCNNFLSECI